MIAEHRSYELAADLMDVLNILRATCEDPDKSAAKLFITLPSGSVDDRLAYIREIERGIIATIDEHLDKGRS